MKPSRSEMKLGLILATGEENWLAYDKKFKSPRKLPIFPSDFCFTSLGEESLCAGTHLTVSGQELGGFVIWTYKLATNRGSKSSSVVNPRCKFGSATDGTFGYVAGGIGIESGRKIWGSAERCNPDTTTKSAQKEKFFLQLFLGQQVSCH